MRCPLCVSVCCVPVNNITPAGTDTPALSQLNHPAWGRSPLHQLSMNPFPPQPAELKIPVNCSFPSFFFATAVTYTCDIAREGGTIDLDYLMMRSTHPMCHSAKQVDSLQEKSPKTAAATTSALH